MSIEAQKVSFTSMSDVIVGSLLLPDDPARCPVVIICHGAGEFKENYQELAEFLASRKIASLSIDMHGHGESEGERFHVRMQAWVADIRAAVEFLAGNPRIDSSKIAGFGLSSGGTALLEAAVIEPRLGALITLSATVRTCVPIPLGLCLRMLCLIGTIKKSLTQLDLRVTLLKAMNGIHFASDPEVDRRLRSDPRMLEAYAAFPFPGAAESVFVNTIKRVGAIKAPTLVLWGEDDELDPPATGHLLYEKLLCPKRLQILPGVGHAAHLDRHRDRVFALTAEWVSEHLATHV